VGNDPVNRVDLFGYNCSEACESAPGIFEKWAEAYVDLVAERDRYNTLRSMGRLDLLELNEEHVGRGKQCDTAGNREMVRQMAQRTGAGAEIVMQWQLSVSPTARSTTAIAAVIPDAQAEGLLSKLWNKCFSKRVKVGCIPPDPKPSVWKLSPFERGRKIEEMLGMNLPSNYPVIDKFANGIATSIKSIDLGAASYQNASGLRSVLNDYVDKVAAFEGRVWAGTTVKKSEIKARQLLLAIPSNCASSVQIEVIEAAIVRAKLYGLES
jgi:hypothetical protein